MSLSPVHSWGPGNFCVSGVVWKGRSLGRMWLFVSWLLHSKCWNGHPWIHWQQIPQLPEDRVSQNRRGFSHFPNKIQKREHVGQEVDDMVKCPLITLLCLKHLTHTAGSLFHTWGICFLPTLPWGLPQCSGYHRAFWGPTFATWAAWDSDFSSSLREAIVHMWLAGVFAPC